MRSCFVVVALIACVSGCKPSEPSKSAPAVEQAPTVPAAASPARSDPRTGSQPPPDTSIAGARDTTPVDARIAGVRLSNVGNTEAGMVGLAVDSFAPDDVVYVEVQTSGSSKAYTLYAKWMASDGNVLADYGVNVGQPGSQRTVISLSKPDGWPKGSNSVRLTINGQPERIETFEIR
jgi:hypothetical protein